MTTTRLTIETNDPNRFYSIPNAHLARIGLVGTVLLVGLVVEVAGYIRAVSEEDRIVEVRRIVAAVEGGFDIDPVPRTVAEVRRMVAAVEGDFDIDPALRIAAAELRMVADLDHHKVGLVTHTELEVGLSIVRGPVLEGNRNSVAADAGCVAADVVVDVDLVYCH